MLQIHGREVRLCDGTSRRELLRVGGLSLAGLGLPTLLQAGSVAAPGPRRGTFGKARSCILLYLVGGPPQHETFDPKPEASAEVRGPYRAISTPVDGLQVGELMPRLAKLAPQYAVIRSMATDINAHTGSGYWMLTGHPHSNRFGESIPAAASDWPHLGAMVKRLAPARSGVPTSVTLPEWLKNNPGIIVAGQHGGFLGAEHQPLMLECDPNAPRFEVSGLSPLPELSGNRIHERRRLLDRVNGTLDRALSAASFARDDSMFEQAFDLLTSQKARRAFALDEEPAVTRDRYGRHKFGQSCLLARRLVQAGVRLVTVNWPREPNDLDKGNPVWDTHLDNAGRLKNALMPPMDQAVTALLEDLKQRGLLDETLVIWMGEFGRTPKFNPNGGRDHWGHVFSLMLCGGGIRGGVVYGSSDRIGAYPESDRLEPPALHATIFHLLGIPPSAGFTDPLNRPLLACEGESVEALF